LLFLKPEQSRAKNPTHLMDVHSFGVILLELVTGKPAEQPASDDSVDIVRWVRRRINVADGASQILDPSISRTAQQGMQAALELALRCTCASAFIRRRRRSPLKSFWSPEWRSTLRA
jgi:hypothetical protein